MIMWNGEKVGEGKKIGGWGLLPFRNEGEVIKKKENAQRQANEKPMNNSSTAHVLYELQVLGIPQKLFLLIRIERIDSENELW